MPALLPTRLIRPRPVRVRAPVCCRVLCVCVVFLWHELRKGVTHQYRRDVVDSAVPPRADADSDHETGGGGDVKGDAAKDDSSLALVVATDPSAQAPSAVAHAMTRTAVGITTGSKVVGDTIVRLAGS